MLPREVRKCRKTLPFETAGAKEQVGLPMPASAVSRGHCCPTAGASAAATARKQEAEPLQRPREPNKRACAAAHQPGTAAGGHLDQTVN